MEESPSPPVSPYTGQIVRPKEKIKKKMPQERIPRKPYKCFKEMSEEFKHSLRKYYRQNGHNRQATSKKFDLSVGTINKILGPHLVEKRGRGRPRKDQAQRTPSTSPSPPNPDAGINPEIKAAAIAKFEETGSYYAAAKAVSHFKISDIINWVKNKNEK